MRQIPDKKLILLFTVLFLISFVSGVSLKPGTVLNTTSSNTSMTFSVEINVTNLTIESTSISLYNLSYVKNSATLTCASYTYSTANTNMQMSDPCTVPSEAAASAGGGGAGPSCTYNWDCTNWFPPACPESEIQERICANRGTCVDGIGIPAQTKTCTYEGPTESLFDIFLALPEKYKKICAGGKIKADIKLENIGKIELLDAFMTYWIIDKNNTLIAEIKDTRAVEDRTEFKMEIKIPESAIQGTHRLYTQITYDINKTAVAGESFEVIAGEVCEGIFISYPVLKYSIFAIAGIVILVVIIFIVKKTKFVIRKSKKKVEKIQIKKSNEPKKLLSRTIIPKKVIRGGKVVEIPSSDLSSKDVVIVDSEGE